MPLQNLKFLTSDFSKDSSLDNSLLTSLYQPINRFSGRYEIN